jgi:Protein of unknown function (DUF4012)
VIVIAGAAVAALLLVAGYFGVQAFLAIRDLEEGVAQLEQVRATLGLSADWTPAQIKAATDLQNEAMSRIAPASSELQSNPLLELAEATPGLHDQAQAVLDLASASDDAAIATGDLVRIAARSPDPAPGAQAGTSTQRLLVLLGGSEPLLTNAQSHLDRAVGQLRGDLGHPLLPPLASKVRTALRALGPAQTTVDEAAEIGRYMPTALGMDGPQTYLLLFANPWEIRPTGGFFGAVGVITFQNGEPVGLEVINEANIAQPPGTLVPVPPALAARLILPNNAMDLGDSGWDPDFRSSAALAEQLYRAGTGRSVDGVVEIDPYAISALLAITGPVNVPPYGTFTSADFFSKLNTLVNVDKYPSGSGKSALGPITETVMSHVIDSPASLLPRLLATGESSASERHVQLFFNNATLAGAAHRADLDGAIAQPGIGTDYLMVVDANVGGNKDDQFISKRTEVKVEVSPDGLAEHEVILTYDYPAGKVDPGLSPGADPAYRDYVRFLLPETSTLQGFYDLTGNGARTGSIEDISIEDGKREIGTFFRLPPGQSIQLRLFYESPVGNDREYRLFVQKQAGIAGRELSVEVSDPGGITRRTAAGRRDDEVSASW